MKKYLLTLLLSVSVELLFAQESKCGDFPKYDITLNSGYQRIDMKDLNAFYEDSFLVYSKEYKPLHHAFYQALQCNYRLSPMLSIGTQLKVDQASVTDRFAVLNRSIAVTGQLDGMVLLRKLIHKPIKNDWNLQVQAGLSYNVMQIKRYSTTLFWCYLPEPWFYSNRIGGNAQVKLSYPIMKCKNAQWRIGLSIGYQFAQSKELSYYEPYASNQIQKTVSLGFSGFNSGLSLTCQFNKRHSTEFVGPSKNAIYVDILGQSIYGAVMYERSLNVSSNGVQHSIAGGYLYLNYIPWEPMNHRMFSFPLSYNASFDFNKTKNLPNKLELGIGVTTSLLKEFGTSEKFRSQEVRPSIRIGYAYHSYRNGLLFKATLTPSFLGINRTVANGQRYTSNGTYVVPLFGISIGKTF